MNEPKTVDLSQEYAFGGISSAGELLSFMVPVAFTIAGVAVTLYMIVGAFRFITSGGNKESVAKAQGMITHAFIGYVLLIVLFFVVQFIPEAIGLKGFKLIK